MSQIGLEVKKVELQASVADPIVLEMGFNFAPPSISTGNGGSATNVSFQYSFTQSNLSIIGLIPITYPVGIAASGLVVYDNNGEVIIPDHWRSLSPTTIELNLESFIPIIGMWTASISL